MDEQTHGLMGQMIALMQGMIAAHPPFERFVGRFRALANAHAAAAPSPPPEVTPPQPDHSGDERPSEL